MALAFDFHPEATAEFFADVYWYDEREDGLGARFESAVRSAIDDALTSPDAWPTWPGGDRVPPLRSRDVRGFPYRIVYLTRGDLLTIVAVAHEKRRPGYWRARVMG